MESDYKDNDIINCEPEQTEEVTEEDKQVPKECKSDLEIGKIVFVSCAAGSGETNLNDTNKTDDISSETNSDNHDDGNNINFLVAFFFFLCLNLLLVVLCYCLYFALRR